MCLGPGLVVADYYANGGNIKLVINANLPELGTFCTSLELKEVVWRSPRHEAHCPSILSVIPRPDHVNALYNAADVGVLSATGKVGLCRGT
jgi:hypothetical protein